MSSDPSNPSLTPTKTRQQRKEEIQWAEEQLTTLVSLQAEVSEQQLELEEEKRSPADRERAHREIEGLEKEIQHTTAELKHWMTNLSAEDRQQLPESLASKLEGL